jgi:hypothetical protein
LSRVWDEIVPASDGAVLMWTTERADSIVDATQAGLMATETP